METEAEVPICDDGSEADVTRIFDLGMVKNGHARWPGIRLGVNTGRMGIDVDAKVDTLLGVSDFGTEETKAKGILFKVLKLLFVICKLLPGSCFGTIFKSNADDTLGTIVETADGAVLVAEGVDV